MKSLDPVTSASLGNRVTTRVEALPPIFPEGKRRAGLSGLIMDNLIISFCCFVVILICAAAILAPFIIWHDPNAFAPTARLRPPSFDHPFGTDRFGRDVYSRVVYGARISLSVGIIVAIASAVIGTLLGLCAGYIRALDSVIMRVIDGMMSIPEVLLAIAMTSLFAPSLTNVVIAIVLVEIPRVARLVRGIVLSLREQVYVDAAVAAGSSTTKIMFKHILPNAVGPLIVQATYICAAAMLLESILSFIGAGVPLHIPTWGNIMSEGRSLLQISPTLVFIPAAVLSITILAINLVGDGLRDALDPRSAGR
jgi:peptide/nickel transport system permease protein